ncbi:MAG: type II toxin-antitoxin system RelE/ParE family toxin [Hymenobacter sp.]|nr:MAG: type II toxin-antitoxin system RelE/ParE family toxin [Hymenobacter sp.]
MIVAGREVIFKAAFLDDLSKFEQYIGRSSATKGHSFTAAVFDFCTDIIAPQPFAFPKFEQDDFNDPAVRRAVFKRHYVLIYRVYEGALRFVTLYHAHQNPPDLLTLEY